MCKIERVKKSEIKQSLAKAQNIIKDLHLHFNKEKEYKFTERLVGSAKWNIVLKDKNGFYDLDFQILLTNNSKKMKNESWKQEDKNEATMIKDDFFNYINETYSDRNKYGVENSTTSITFIDKENKFSIDFVLIKILSENNQIIRRNNSAENPTVNNYVWNELSENNEAYTKFKNLSPIEKEDVIENYILPRKKKEKEKDSNDPSLISSSRIFKEEVNNYVARKENN